MTRVLDYTRRRNTPTEFNTGSNNYFILVIKLKINFKLTCHQILYFKQEAKEKYEYLVQNTLLDFYIQVWYVQIGSSNNIVSSAD